EPSAESVFQDALDLPLADREAYVRHQCAGNASLQEEVLTLLAHFQRAEGGVLDRPAVPDLGLGAMAPGPHFRYCRRPER
ncbi:MAG: hypothetical protein AAF637_14950, partial [Pseudomonadota bacterium]